MKGPVKAFNRIAYSKEKLSLDQEQNAVKVHKHFGFSKLQKVVEEHRSCLHV